MVFSPAGMVSEETLSISKSSLGVFSLHEKLIINIMNITLYFNLFCHTCRLFIKINSNLSKIVYFSY